MASEKGGTWVYCDDGDGEPFHIAESMDEFRLWFNTAKTEGVPSIEVTTHHSGSKIEVVTDHIVAFAPARNQKPPIREDPSRAQLCCCGHKKDVHTDGIGRCQYAPDIGVQCGCEGFEAH